MSLKIPLSDFSFSKIEVSIDATEVYKRIDKIVEESAGKECVEVLNGILNILKLPKEQDVKDFVKRLGEKYVFSRLFEVILVDELNRPILRIPPEKREEFDKNRHYLGYLKLHALFSSDLFNKLEANRFPIFDCILKKLHSNSFLQDDMVFIEKGILEHKNKNFMASILILGLRIEGIIRSILRKHHVNTLRTFRDGTTEEKSLGHLFKMQRTRKILGNDLYQYLRVLLIRKEGENIRNRLAHSLTEYDEFNDKLSSLLILTLLFLDQKMKTM